MGVPGLTVPEENTCGCIDRADDGGSDCLCSAAGLVQIIGRRYALRILFLIGDHKNIRFNEIRSEMDDMSTSTLSVRLSELERAGLIHRRMYAEIPPRVEYTLTKEGDKLRKSLFALSKFATRRST